MSDSVYRGLWSPVRIAAFVSILVGSLVLVGWAFHSDALKHLIPGYANMMPNTALGLIVAGAALLFVLEQDGPAWSRCLAVSASAFVFVLGALTLLEIFGSYDLHIDQILITGSLSILGDVHFVRMPAFSAANFVLLGTSLLCLSCGWIVISQSFAAVLATSAYLSLLSSGLGIAKFSEFQGSIPLPHHSPFTFLLLAIGLLWTRSSQGFVGILSQNNYGGTFARRLAPAALLVPALLTWVRVEGQSMGLYSVESGSAMLTTSLTLLLVVGTFLMVREFGKRDAAGREIAVSLQDRELRWSRLFDQIGEGIVTLDEHGIIETVNRTTEKWFGYGAEELKGLNITRLLSSPHREMFDRDLASGESIGNLHLDGIGREVQALCKGGLTFPMDLAINEFSLHGRKLFSGVMRNVIERKDAEKMTHHFAAIVDGSGDAIIGKTLDGTITSWNRGAEEIFGYSANEMLGASISRLLPSDLPNEEQEIMSRIRRGERVEPYKTERIAKDGHRLNVYLTVSPIFDENHQVVGASKIARDITAQTGIEEQLRQSQRMEAVGQLAGSIAHDFNNLLTVINGYADLSLRGVDPSDPMHRRLLQIHASGERGAALTQHLLAFSRKQVLQPVVLNVNAVITGMDQLLRRLVKENIQIEIYLDPLLPPVTADPHQIEQVVMNLVINARDAMPRGGKITVQTNTMVLSGHQSNMTSDLPPGTYAVIRVSDCGTGIDASVKSRIFEPFFTTKPRGQGTGLGLATVLGVVTQSGGSIGVNSEVGVGTTFRVYLPITLETASDASPKPKVKALIGSETILLVEDDEGLRGYATEVLQRFGYLVYAAQDGVAALAIAKEQGPKIDLLVSDLIMPNMGGEELVKKLRATIGAPRVLFMSGYPEDALLVHGGAGSTTAFLAKPFTPEQLGAKVREALDTVGVPN